MNDVVGYPSRHLIRRIRSMRIMDRRLDDWTSDRTQAGLPSCSYFRNTQPLHKNPHSQLDLQFIRTHLHSIPVPNFERNPRILWCPQVSHAGLNLFGSRMGLRRQSIVDECCSFEKSCRGKYDTRGWQQMSYWWWLVVGHICKTSSFRSSLMTTHYFFYPDFSSRWTRYSSPSYDYAWNV